MGMEDFTKFFNGLLHELEGWSFENVTGDKGGDTNSGITQSGFDAFCQKKGLVTHSVETLTEDEKQAVYLDIWYSSFSSFMDWPLDIVNFDLAINGGIHKASTLLQTVIGGLVVDGMIGPKTLQAVRLSDPQRLADRLLDARAEWYKAIVVHDPSQSKFLDGWLARVEKLREYIK